MIRREKEDDTISTLIVKMTTYMLSETICATEDYRYLEDINNTIAERYDVMTQQATQSLQTLGELEREFASIQTHFVLIDQLEQNVSRLEQATLALDAYSRDLGKFLVKKSDVPLEVKFMQLK